MQLTKFLFTSLAIISSTSATAFPSSVTSQGILNIQNQILNVINDIVQLKYDQIATDYSSTGRGLNFLSRDVLGGQNCPDATTGNPAGTANEAIADLQNTQLILSELSLDVINSDLEKGKIDVCRAVSQYGDVASYVQQVRTDSQ